MPTTKEIYNQVKEAEAKIDQAQSDFDVMEKRLGEIEEENPELENAPIEFRGYRIPRNEIEFVEKLEKEMGVKVIGLDKDIDFITIKDGHIVGIDLTAVPLIQMDLSLPEKLEELVLAGTGIRRLDQSLPGSLRLLNIKDTPLDVDPRYDNALEYLKLHIERIPGLVFIRSRQ